MQMVAFGVSLASVAAALMALIRCAQFGMRRFAKTTRACFMSLLWSIAVPLVADGCSAPAAALLAVTSLWVLGDMVGACRVFSENGDLLPWWERKK